MAHWCLSKRFSVLVHVVREVLNRRWTFSLKGSGSGASKRTQKLSHRFDAL